jgi:arylsulfatase A-like enzyme
VDEVVSWLEAGRDHRDFLFLHTFEIHDPYTDTRFTSGLPGGRIESDFGNHFASSDFWANRDTTSEEKAYAEALYDGDIAFVDERLGVIFAELEQRDLLENCIIMITSDHGEQFWEHGSWRHGSTVYDHQLLVPLIMYLPEALREQLGMKPGKVIEQQVQLVDLVPTILDLVGVESAYELQGVSLRALLEGESTPPRRAFAEHTNVRTYERKAFRTEKYKVVYSFPKKKGTEMEPLYELYDLQADPLELNNIADQYPEFVQAQVEEMKILRRGVPAAPLEEEVPEGLDPDLVERLKALGYVDN